MRTWPTRLALVVSLLAVLGTSKPAGWSLDAAIPVPATAKPDRLIKLEIESSAEPQIITTGGPGTYSDSHMTPCLDRWTKGRKLACLIPPSVTLDGVKIAGGCKGCDGSCPPPKAEFVRVTPTEVAYWTDTASSRTSASVPSHGKTFIATRFVVLVSGAGAAQVKYSVTDPTSGAVLTGGEQSCRLETGSPLPVCRFLVYDDVVKATPSVTITAEGTGWGECPSGATAPCASPKTFRIDSIRIEP
jgi:hypothetical protein